MSTKFNKMAELLEKLKAMPKAEKKEAIKTEEIPAEEKPKKKKKKEQAEE
jgi:hypothetical protein